MPITRIRLERFRGATQPIDLHFSPNKKMVLIFGENGSGKSTIVDGIDLVCNKSPGSIAEISSTSVAEHLHSLGATQAQLRVDIECNGVVCTGRVSGRNPQVPATPAPPMAHILRRSNLLSLVTAKPFERFERLKRLIDVELVLKSEDRLKDAINEMRSQVEAKTREQTIHTEALQAAYRDDHTEAEAGLTPEQWAEQRIAASRDSLETDAQALKGLLDLWGRLELLLQVKNERQEQLNSAREARDTEKAALAAQLAAMPELIAEILPVLESASTYFGVASSAETCPVCTQRIETGAVRTSLEQRLEPLRAILVQKQKLKEAEEKVKSLETVTRQAYTDLAERLHEFLDALADATPTVAASIPVHPADFPTLSAWTGGLTREVIGEIPRLMAALAPAKAAAEQTGQVLQRQASQASGIRRALEALRTARREAARLQRTLDQLQSFLDVVRRKRIEYTNAILEAIADDCDRLYQRIHPNEGIGAVRFHLDEERRGSLHQTGTFAGQPGKIPQAYFSESHLDTLGVCFFVTLARYTSGTGCIIVLDDVFSAIDLHHIKRLLNVLVDEAQSFQQVILTTHQRRWLDLFKTQQIASQSVEVKELFPWSMSAGLVCRDGKTHIERLRAELREPTTSRDTLAAHAGQGIEMVLGTMTQHLRCTIQRTPADRYTAVELLNAMKKPARTLKFSRDGIEAPETAEVLRTVLEDLTGNAVLVRNTLGAHFNWDGCDIDHRTARQFAEDTLRLVDIFLCADCQTVLTREDSSCLKCRCGRRAVLKEWR